MYIFKKRNRQGGLTYIELIVVLSIFSVLSSVVIYRYGDFQSKVDIKNLASDIGLKIVEAQKASLSGLLPQASVSADWKPSYGVHFTLAEKLSDTRFIYFTDIDSNNMFDGEACNGECLEEIKITKNNKIYRLDAVYGSGEKGEITALQDLTITFSRPDSGAKINSSGIKEGFPISYAQITIISPNSSTARIKVYPSGRIQVDSPTPAEKGSGGKEDSGGGATVGAGR